MQAEKVDRKNGADHVHRPIDKGVPNGLKCNAEPPKNTPRGCEEAHGRTTRSEAARIYKTSFRVYVWLHRCISHVACTRMSASEGSCSNRRV